MWQKMKNRSHRCDINRPRPSHGHKLDYIALHNDGYMYQATPKQHLKLNL